VVTEAPSCLLCLSLRQTWPGVGGQKASPRSMLKAWCFSWAPDLALRLLPACCSLGGRPCWPLQVHLQSRRSPLPSGSHTVGPGGDRPAWGWWALWPLMRLWPLIARGCVLGWRGTARRRPPLLVGQDLQVAARPPVSPVRRSSRLGPRGSGPACATTARGPCSCSSC